MKPHKKKWEITCYFFFNFFFQYLYLHTTIFCLQFLYFSSYGFKKQDCLDTLIQCNGDAELSLHMLYVQYFNDRQSFAKFLNNKPSTNNLASLRNCEQNILKTRYKSFFIVNGNVWTFKLKLDHLLKLSEIKLPSQYTIVKIFILDIIITPKYPLVPPLVLLKPDKFLECPLNLQISKALFMESQKYLGNKQPIAHILTLLENENSLNSLLGMNSKFIFPVHLNEQKKSEIEMKNENIKMNPYFKQDQMIVNEYLQRKCLRDYKIRENNRKKLPAWKKQEEILNLIRNQQFIILKGETGCGKSTQVPQYIFDDWIENFSTNGQHIEIVCTQPRRVSALGVAKRVADERFERVGHTIGYQIRFDHCTSENTRLTFCTMGVLLKKLQMDPNLGKVTHIIVDEVHERSAER